MKKTIFALFSLLGVAMGTTYEPLSDADGWVSDSIFPNRHLTHVTPTIQDGSYRWETNWGQGYSSFSLPDAITLTAGTSDVLSLKYTLTTGISNNGVMTLALVGGSGTSTIVSGMSYGSPLRYAVTENTTTTGYTFSPEASWGQALQGTALNKATAGSTSYTIGYDIRWDEADSRFELTVNLGGTNTDPIGLGEADLAFTGLIITTDGGHQEEGSYATISNLTVSSVPEPTTATLSLLALAGLAARRRRH